MKQYGKYFTNPGKNLENYLNPEMNNDTNGQ